ncbi:uncharacterized protein Dana_GF26270 [Drosophila ananassae]|uniref:C-type lectin domain-containing protein n=1 Tax=Drosophila ananassae TaxID=7217 RepID=A0A0P8XF85_DROAN|nr:uncharacterized protein LOC6497534 isoform X1 [Drosophila ananassae]KPU73221.1 uncharacterized protein Dana_GF26270 [Drosophila ananassae]
MHLSHLLLVFLPLSCLCDSVFDRIGDGYYFIESENLSEHYYDWFFARLDCWRHTSNLVSVETVEELKDLEQYVLSKGYDEGTTFATSGHSFRTAPDFWWDGVDKAVTFDRWLPGKPKPSKKSYLSLRLINSTLYMQESFGQDDYFICEYKFSAPMVWRSLNQNTRLIVLVILWLISIFILYKIIVNKKHSSREKENDEENLIKPTQSKNHLADSAYLQSNISII